MLRCILCSKTPRGAHDDAHLLNILLEGPQDGVVLEKVGGLLHSARVVHHNHLQVGVGAVHLAPKEVPANAAKAVDGHTQLLGLSLRGKAVQLNEMVAK